MEVYVVTEAMPMGPEIYDSVYATKKGAEKYIRRNYPNARVMQTWSDKWIYYCKDNGLELLMIINKQTIQ